MEMGEPRSAGEKTSDTVAIPNEGPMVVKHMKRAEYKQEERRSGEERRFS